MAKDFEIERVQFLALRLPQGRRLLFRGVKQLVLAGEGVVSGVGAAHYFPGPRSGTVHLSVFVVVALVGVLL
jgi:hypothetical protein